MQKELSTKTKKRFLLTQEKNKLSDLFIYRHGEKSPCLHTRDEVWVRQSAPIYGSNAAAWWTNTFRSNRDIMIVVKHATLAIFVKCRCLLFGEFANFWSQFQSLGESITNDSTAFIQSVWVKRECSVKRCTDAKKHSRSTHVNFIHMR